MKTMATLIQQLETKRTRREEYDALPRPPLSGTLEAVKLLIGLLELNPSGIPSKLLTHAAHKQGIKKFHLDTAKYSLKLKGKRITLEKGSTIGREQKLGAGSWLIVATEDTPRAIELLLNPPHATPEPSDLTADENALLDLYTSFTAGRLKGLAIRLPDRTIPNSHIHAALFFSINNPKPHEIQIMLDIARALKG